MFSAQQDRRWLHPGAVGIHAAALIDPMAVFSHDAHGAARQLSQPLGDALLDSVQHPARDRHIQPHFQHQMGKTRIIAYSYRVDSIRTHGSAFFTGFLLGDWGLYKKLCDHIHKTLIEVNHISIA